jgi:hypothetical protein
LRDRIRTSKIRLAQYDRARLGLEPRTAGQKDWHHN